MKLANKIIGKIIKSDKCSKNGYETKDDDTMLTLMIHAKNKPYPKVKRYPDYILDDISQKRYGKHSIHLSPEQQREVYLEYKKELKRINKK